VFTVRLLPGCALCGAIKKKGLLESSPLELVASAIANVHGDFKTETQIGELGFAPGHLALQGGYDFHTLDERYARIMVGAPGRRQREKRENRLMIFMRCRLRRRAAAITARSNRCEWR
jgi:hypothetical protein